MSHRGRLSVSLAMIVRDEEERLPTSLRSVHGLFDEVVVLDTGSRDASREVAHTFGAAVFECDWCDDFSAARNAAQDRCRCDYIFWMDADETLPRRAQVKLRRLLNELPDEEAVYAVSQTSHRLDGVPGLAAVPAVRLAPNRPGVRWARRVYERLLWDPGLASNAATLAPIELLHHGFSDFSVVVAKLERNERLVEIELERESEDSVALCNLAATHYNLGRVLASRQHYMIAKYYIQLFIDRFALASSDATENETAADAYMLLVRTLLELLAYSDAIATCDQARAAYPQNLALLCCEAALLAECGLWAQARDRWQLMPSLKGFRNSPAMRLNQYAGLLAAKAHYAYFLEENGLCYDAAAVWTELAQNCANSFDAIPGVRRTICRMLRDAVRRPGHFVSSLNRAFAPKADAGQSHQISTRPPNL
jgi:glycosyltransferase involved in cell wall biosynthesis